MQPDCLFQRIAFLRLGSMVVTAETQPAAKSANTRKRAQIFANERELKIYAFQNSRVSAKTLWRRTNAHVLSDIISWIRCHDNCTTIGQWWPRWNPGNVPALVCARPCHWDGWVFKGWFVALFFGDVANAFFWGVNGHRFPWAFIYSFLKL